MKKSLEVFWIHWTFHFQSNACKMGRWHTLQDILARHIYGQNWLHQPTDRHRTTPLQNHLSNCLYLPMKMLKELDDWFHVTKINKIMLFTVVYPAQSIAVLLNTGLYMGCQLHWWLSRIGNSSHWSCGVPPWPYYNFREICDFTCSGRLVVRFNEIL